MSVETKNNTSWLINSQQVHVVRSSSWQRLPPRFLQLRSHGIVLRQFVSRLDGCVYGVKER